MQQISTIGARNLNHEAKYVLSDFLQNKFNVDNYLDQIEEKGLNFTLSKLKQLSFISNFNLQDNEGRAQKWELQSVHKKHITQVALSKFIALLEEDELRPDYMLRQLALLIECHNVLQFDSATRADFKKIAHTVASSVSLDEFRNAMIRSKNSFTVVNSGAKHSLTALAQAHGADFDKLEINDFLNLVELYKLADSKDENSFNCLINAFGQNFHDYRENQLVAFVKNLAQVGLN